LGPVVGDDLWDFPIARHDDERGEFQCFRQLRIWLEFRVRVEHKFWVWLVVRDAFVEVVVRNVADEHDRDRQLPVGEIQQPLERRLCRQRQQRYPREYAGEPNEFVEQFEVVFVVPFVEFQPFGQLVVPEVFQQRVRLGLRHDGNGDGTRYGDRTAGPGHWETGVSGVGTPDEADAPAVRDAAGSVAGGADGNAPGNGCNPA